MAEALRSQSCVISMLARAELRDGQALMAPDDRRHALIDAFLLSLAHLPWTGAAADHFGSLKAHDKRTGTPRGDIDALIAAQALAEGMVLVTHDQRHFASVPGLVCEDWLA